MTIDELLPTTAMHPDLPLAVTHEVRDLCLCLHLQRAARAVARRFDDAFRPFGLTNGQFSILTALNRPQPPRMVEVAEQLAMDRTTLTAALKPLRRRSWVEVTPDVHDGRSRRLHLTPAGQSILRDTVPVWRSVLADIARERPELDLDAGRGFLAALAAPRPADRPAGCPVGGLPTVGP